MEIAEGMEINTLMKTSRINNLGHYVHEKDRYASRTAQFLFMGASLAIIALVFAFFMLLFRSLCDGEFHRGMYTLSPDGTKKICKVSSGMVSEAISETKRIQHGMLVNIAWAKCHNDNDCSEFQVGFCAGGPAEKQGIYVRDYCKQNACICKDIIHDCGINHEVKFDAVAADILDGCEELACNTTLSITIPKWMMHRNGFFGCTWRVKTGLEEAMLSIQSRTSILGFTLPLKPLSDPVWNKLKTYLARTPAVEFGSFWPSSISESVSKASSPEQKIFLGFMLIAALCLCSSDYTTHCKTADLPGKVVPWVQLEWNTLRTWLPPLGLLLLSTVQMVPSSKIYNFPHSLMSITHHIGALFTFVVYLSCEVTVLRNPHNLSEMQPHEKIIRWVAFLIGAIAMVIFSFVYSILNIFTGHDNPYVKPPLSGMSDLYERNTITEQSTLVRPAEGLFDILKKVSYVAEFTCGMSILVSHLVIWHFFKSTLARERAMFLADFEEKH